MTFVGDEPVAEARDTARRFLTEAQAVHGIPVSGRAMGMVQLVVSELVTNAYKYARSVPAGAQRRRRGDQRVGHRCDAPGGPRR